MHARTPAQRSVWFFLRCLTRRVEPAAESTVETYATNPAGKGGLPASLSSFTASAAQQEQKAFKPSPVSHQSQQGSQSTHSQLSRLHEVCIAHTSRVIADCSTPSTWGGTATAFRESITDYHLPSFTPLPAFLALLPCVRSITHVCPSELGWMAHSPCRFKQLRRSAVAVLLSRASLDEPLGVSCTAQAHLRAYNAASSCCGVEESFECTRGGANLVL